MALSPVQSEQITQLTSLLHSNDPATAAQGCEMVQMLDDPTITAHFAAGGRIKPSGEIVTGTLLKGAEGLHGCWVTLLLLLRLIEQAGSPLPKAIDLSGRGLDAAAMRILAAQPSLRALKLLRLESNAIGPEGAAVLATSPHLCALRELDLRNTDIGPRGAEAIASSENVRRLVWLHAHKHDLTDDGMRALARSSQLPLTIRRFWRGRCAGISA